MVGGDGDGLCGFLLVDFGELLFCFCFFEEGIEFGFDVGLPVGGFDGFDLLLGGGFCLCYEGADFEAGFAEDVGELLAAVGEVCFAFR